MSALYTAFRTIAFAHLSAGALVAEDGQYTYGQALSRIDGLAAILAGSSRTAALVVGPKTADTVLWQLACNKKGKVFIPCDAATPAGRLADILARTQPQCVISSNAMVFSDLGYQLMAKVGSHVVWVRAAGRVYAEEVSHIIFSSGSTGQPKAILLRDEPVVSVVLEQAKQIGVGPGARFAWMLSPAFDASLSDIYATLLTGAELHVCSFSMRSVKTLQAYFKHHRITHSDLSPSLLPLLTPDALPELRGLIFGGELAKESVVFAWREAGKRLFNAYGPTETTICSSLREVSEGWTATNIGQPLPGVAYLLRYSEQFEPGRPGDQGELYIAGTHLAVGYDDPTITRERFIERDGQLYYKTGDVVAVDKQGDYHFKGRVDRQMKFHGVLICPEEVEAQALHAGCSEALLKLEADRLTLHYAGAVSEADLKAALKDKLLALALPHRYLRHEALPKSIAGKIQL